MPPDAALIAAQPPASESGQWQRHVSSRFVREALDGRTGDGRWGTRRGFPVLYLGRPRASVIAEAYRRYVDPIEESERGELLRQIAPRVLVSCEVAVTNLLDLRRPGARAEAGLTLSDLTSATNDAEAYAKCRAVAQLAHQLGRHGIVAPAATGLGETLALFTDVLPVAERPVRLDLDEHWSTLPEDPREAPRARALRIVD